SNRRLYGREGIQACRRALRKQGCLAVWSAEPSKKFEQILMSCSFHVRRFRVSAYKGSKSKSRFVWVASEDKTILPRGGGEPRPPLSKESKGSPRRPRDANHTNLLVEKLMIFLKLQIASIKRKGPHPKTQPFFVFIWNVF
ncbi:MAG: hypothetical protein JRF25_06430, partial [Deltaproteobacteria bacterium]|nr:hypothetical protein [Deltaproteobacteria bacterium]